MIATKEKIYKKAHTEVNEVIKILSEEEKKKIPKVFISNLQNNMDTDYIFKLDMSKSLLEQNLMPETKALIVEIYERFLAPENEKELWERYDRICLEKIEKQKQEKYNSNDLFKNKEKYEVVNQEKQNEKSLTVMPKENIFKRIISKIKRIFEKSK